MAALIFLGIFLTAIIILGVSLTQLIIVAAGSNAQRREHYGGPICSILLGLSMIAVCLIAYARATGG